MKNEFDNVKHTKKEVIETLKEFLSKFPGRSVFISFEECFVHFGRMIDKMEKRAEKEGVIITLHRKGFLVTSKENIKDFGN